MRSIIKISFAVALLASVTSCQKLVDNGPMKTALTPDKVFSDSASTVGAVTALYARYGNGASLILNCNQYGAMSADEGYQLTNATVVTEAYRTNTLIPDYTRPITDAAYSGIYAANMNLENIPGNTAISAKLRNQLLAESKFMRAYFYFYIVGFYGDMPLALTSDVKVNSSLTRSPSADIYNQMIKDLTEAKAVLTDTYPSAERARVNKKAVSALLARVYLYTKNYKAAESEATEVINSGLYSLESDLNNVFIKTSNEIIWQIESNSSAAVKGVSPMGLAFIPASTVPTFVLHDAMNNAFETSPLVTDKRSTAWRKAITYNSTTYYYPFKYKYRSTTVSGNEYSVMLRLAEQYLIRAEARAQQGNIAGAQDDINRIRGRAGLGNTTATDLNSMMLALEKERWVELFTENADRWLNLRRTGRISTVLKVNKGSFSDYQALYPVAKSDILNNPNLTQNPGY